MDTGKSSAVVAIMLTQLQNREEDDPYGWEESRRIVREAIREANEAREDNNILYFA